MQQLKHLARKIFSETIAAIDIPATMQRKLQRKKTLLTFGETRIDLQNFEKLRVVAFGTMGSTAAGMLGLGLSASAIFITATTLIQHETPHELLGRVMSCLMSLVAGSQVISMFVAGPVAEKIGIPNLYYGSAALLVGIGIVGYFNLPKLEKAEPEKAQSATG